MSNRQRLRDEFVYLNEVVDGIRVKVVMQVVGDKPNEQSWVLDDALVTRAVESNQKRLRMQFQGAGDSGTDDDEDWYCREVMPEVYDGREQVVMERE